MNTPPVSFEQIVDLAEGSLPSEEAEVLRARVAADPVASQTLADLEQLIALMRGDDSVDPPEEVLQRALRIFPRREPFLDRARRVLAALRFDSWQQPLAAGVRSGVGEVRHLLYATNDRELDLRIMPGDDGWRLIGQVLGPEEAGEVVLVGPVTVSATLNDSCEFELPSVPAGRYDLLLRQGDQQLVIEAIEIGPPGEL
ncbi:MAG: hypothetical protein OHK0015_10450 [Chloroflexi bacterium OHK40]